MMTRTKQRLKVKFKLFSNQHATTYHMFSSCRNDIECSYFDIKVFNYLLMIMKLKEMN